ncbi:hypothetical protein BH20VER2_BH20VER2_18190 [soil metagenome]
MLVVSIGVHLLFLVGAGIWVVSRYAGPRKLTFNAGPKSPNPSERALQHRVQMQKLQNKSMPEAVPKRVLTTGMAKISLPPMPEISVPKTDATSPMMAGSRAGGFSATAGLGGGALGGTGGGNPINFFGIRDTATSVVIMIDISDSMFGRTGDYDYSSRKLLRVGQEQSFQHVRDEAIKLVQNLTPGTRFGIIRWSGGAYSWKPELVAATEENKQAAAAHIQNDLDIRKAPKRADRPGGTRHDYALEEAFKLKPETIYMLTDGDANGDLPDGSGKITAQYLYNIVDEAQKNLPRKAKLHTIYYLTGKDKPEEERMLRQLANRTGGTLIKVNAKQPGAAAAASSDGAKPQATPTPRPERKKKARGRR